MGQVAASPAGESLRIAGLSRVAPPPIFVSGSSSPYAINDRLREVEIIGLGEIDGPEDVILDEDDNLYCSVRQGEIVRFLAPDYASAKSTPMSADGRSAWPSTGTAASSCASPAWASIASTGCASQEADGRDQSLALCRSSTIPACGSPTISTSRQTARSISARRRSVTASRNGSSTRWKGAATAGSSATTRRRDVTRTILRNLLFANGVCMAHDNHSVLFAETWGCRISRYWLDGPKAGTIEAVIPDLPGYPDNINRGIAWNLLGLRWRGCERRATIWR